MHNQNGSQVLLVMTIVLSVLTVGFGGFSVWAYLNYQEQKNNVDGIVAESVVLAQEQQKATDEAGFVEREKLPTRQFVGPADLGQVTFDFPKTWSLYIEADGSAGTGYNAYFHPGAVSNPTRQQPYALRVVILNSTYENSLAAFQQGVQDGTLKASAITVNGQVGTRFDGKLGQSNGSLVLLKSRDKSIEIFTESDAFLGDFNNIILPSLKFNP
ncbi:MAG TPA: hypothetical protein VLA77_04655 [Candidatus Saccharimonadales bacterium]|nr:hypothetical protein [Candidatus Saccharimonadales bacterium]